MFTNKLKHTFGPGAAMDEGRRDRDTCTGYWLLVTGYCLLVTGNRLFQHRYILMTTLYTYIITEHRMKYGFRLRLRVSSDIVLNHMAPNLVGYLSPPFPAPVTPHPSIPTSGVGSQATESNICWYNSECTAVWFSLESLVSVQPSHAPGPVSPSILLVRRFVRNVSVRVELRSHLSPSSPPFIITNKGGFSKPYERNIQLLFLYNVQGISEKNPQFQDFFTLKPKPVLAKNMSQQVTFDLNGGRPINFFL